MRLDAMIASLLFVLPCLPAPPSESPASELGRAIVQAAELETPAERIEHLVPVVERTCDLDRALADWAWPTPADAAEHVDAFVHHAAGRLAGLAERGPTGFRLEASGDGGALVGRFDDADGEVARVELELGAAAPDARIVALRESPGGPNELVGSGASVLARAGPDGLATWLAAELERPRESAGATVERLWRGLLTADQAGGFEARYRRLEPLIDSTHHFRSIAILTIGRSAFEELDPAAAARFVATFRELSIATYASRFDDTAGVTFTLTGDGDWRRGIRQVTGELKKRNGEVVALEYWMKRQRGRWDVLNVVADGVSDISLKKAEYGPVLKERGLEALIGELEAQTARLRE